MTRRVIAIADPKRRPVSDLIPDLPTEYLEK
jgi:hypothetical protein